MLSLDKKTVVALGYFDSVHKGHKKVIERAREIAEKISASFVVFTFDGNLKKALFNSSEKCVYTKGERQKILNEIGVENIEFLPCSKEFLGLERRDFLDYINARYNIVCYVSGLDYHFGKNGEGDIDYLREYSKEKNQNVEFVDIVNIDKEKISTTLIKECLSNGKIERANELLGRSFSITGKVVKDRGIGRSLGFPTANIKVPDDKETVSDGVYYGHALVNNTKYMAIINYGNRPTYDLVAKVLEVNLIDFDGDLYDKELTVYFDGKIRDILKFSSEEQLKEQLIKDRKFVKERKG